VRAHLPARYDPSFPRPALWLFDGQNVFGDEGSYAGGWHAHEALDRFAARKKPVAPVIVAVDHGGEARLEELTPWKVQGRGGEAARFVDAMAAVVMPAVRARIALRSEPEANVVGGSSLGGLAAMWAHLARPAIFGGAMGMSPSLFVGGGAIFALAEGVPVPWRTRVYLDAGKREAGGALFELAGRLHDVLLRRGFPRDRLMWRPDAKGTHSEKAWRRRLPKALAFLFP
jgi:predicted alpha/beta superfamily hydrolase